jgi:hypothetical protein
MASRDEARRAKVAVLELVEGDDAVNGVGIAPLAGEGGYSVKVNLARPLRPERALPDEIDGVPVVVEVIGTVRPQN